MPAALDFPFTINRDAKVIDPQTGQPWQKAEGVESTKPFGEVAGT